MAYSYGIYSHALVMTLRRQVGVKSFSVWPPSSKFRRLIDAHLQLISLLFGKLSRGK